MSVTRSLSCVAVVWLIACTPDATAPQPTLSASGPPAASATGGAHWTIPPERFGFTVENTLAFTAHQAPDGGVSGRIEYHQSFLGFDVRLNAEVTCMAIYDGNRVKYGGPVRVSNDQDVPVDVTYIWFQGIDNGEGAGAVPDQSTIAGIGDESANEAFCASPAPPVNRFDVQGNIQVR
jgi:hypothetical protein